MPERLQKYLARSGVASRRAAERLISAGRVRVNGAVVAALGATVEATEDRVEVDGRAVAVATAHRYLLLNKPRGVMSTVSDPQSRPTVVQIVPHDERLFPVGRLDFDSEGLILLTDDGELAFRLTHPRHGVEKEYLLLVRGSLDRTVLTSLRQGVSLDGKLTAPADVRLDRAEGPFRWLRVVLHEGRNRQIRRMAAALGLEVVRLIRVRLGPLKLGDLKSGQWRHLTDQEVVALSKATR